MWPSSVIGSNLGSSPPDGFRAEDPLPCFEFSLARLCSYGPELAVLVEFCRLASSVRSVIGVSDLGWDSDEWFGLGLSNASGGRR
jgi:hypothetical protein